jgi:molybdate transport system substrate-binding protein
VRRPALVLASLAIAACGDDEALVVSAASSLQTALTACAPDARISFAGSDELAAQIRRGVRPDVYAAASMDLPRALAREGLLSEPVPFATNDLVVAVPAGSRIARLEDLGERGVRVAVGAPSVPVGTYTRRVLQRLGGLGRRVLANVRTEEPDAKGIVGKLTRGAVDAGIVFATDVRSAPGLFGIALPADVEIVYGAGVVDGAGDAAEDFVDDLRRGSCRLALDEAGFGPAP